MFKAKPIDLSPRAGLIGFILLLTAIVGFVIKWAEFKAFLLPNGFWLNWRFVGFLCIASAFAVFMAMNALWKRDNTRLEELKKENADVRNRLSESERKRKTDVITGIPNASSFGDDVRQFFAQRPAVRQAQIILIDIVGFKKVNLEHGYLKGDALLRLIAQHVQSIMRRSEGIYKHPDMGGHPKTLLRQIYRRYPGGDEFVFLIEGDQHEALGFVVNRLHPAFKSLSEEAARVLGAPKELSFRCAIAPFIPGDSPDDLLERVGTCYSLAAHSKASFAIAWYPIDLEPKEPAAGVAESDADKRRREDRARWYKKARQLFEVMNLEGASKPTTA